MNDRVLSHMDSQGIITLSLNRPARHNALNGELIAALLEALQSSAENPAVRVLILTGTGASFSSGADLEWLRRASARDAGQLAVLMQALSQLNKPLIARINGPAFGGGIGLIACCDLAIADTTARFAFSEVRLGLVPAVIAPYIIRAIGSRQARRLFLTAEGFSGETALRLGLVHQLVAGDALDAAVARQSRRLLKAGPVALQTCKQLVRQLAEGGSAEDGADLLARLRTSAEAQAGMTAFLERRKAPWDQTQ